ncbi:M48 family metalloprotease [Streptomyces sp. NPDC091371]|uniref:M48 family metalloprotease n=1 Tax=Streptomyces sp. NPDC091371 TaxID=3155303 RepID=UPI003425F196
MNQPPEPEYPEYPQTPPGPPGQPPQTPQPPQYPQTPQTPQPPRYPAYPQTQQPPPHPQSAPLPQDPQPPTYPQPSQYPQYPQSPQAPAYPQSPQFAPQAPAYPAPQPPAPQAPAYPAAQPQPQPPAYPLAPQAPQQGHAYPQAHPAAAPPQGPVDDLEYQIAPGTRVHLKANQRGTDATAFGQLALHVPGFLMSLIVVLLVATILEALTGLPYWIPTLLWVASGALVFHRPSEDFFARHLLRLHRPLPHELAALTPVWREVTARAGVDGSRYELWIEDSEHLNAYAAAGHIVGVTRYALDKLPRAQLAAVLAHELGHHTGGHAWSGLLGWWYSLPGRIAWQVIRAVTLVLISVTSFFSYLAAGVLIIVVAVISLATITATYGLPLILLVMPYLTAAVGRKAELRADEHAAVLGFAPMLAQMLHGVMAAEEHEKQAVLAATGKPFTEPGTLSRLLSTHPDHRTRLHHLQPYLQPTGR